MLRDQLGTLAAALFGGVVALSGTWLSSSVQDRELDLRYFEVAISILRDEANNEAVRPIRGWAVDIINETAPVKISDEIRTALLENRISEGEIRLAAGGALFSLPIVYEAMQNTLAEGADPTVFSLDGVESFRDVE